MMMEELFGVIREHGKTTGPKGVELRKQSAAALAALPSEGLVVGEDAEDSVELVCFLARQSESARDALATLVNVTAWAHERGQPTMEAVVTRIAATGALKEAAKRATRGDAAVTDAALRLLQNASTVESASDALHPAFETLLKPFAARRGFSFSEDRDSGDGDPLARFGCVLQNLTATSDAARRSLLKRSTGILKTLLGGHLASGNVDRRRGVAAALKHCALLRDEHFYLFDELDAGAVVVRVLAHPDDVDRMERHDQDDLAAFLGGTLPDTPRESDPDVAALLLETLFCFSGTRRLRKILKDAKVYYVVRDLDLFFSGLGQGGQGAKDDDDTENEPAAKGILVTTDDGANDDDDGSGDDTHSRVSRVCADLADMLLRDEPEEVRCETTFAAPQHARQPPQQKANTSKKPSFDGLQGGFLTSKKQQQHANPPVDSFDLPD